MFPESPVHDGAMGDRQGPRSLTAKEAVHVRELIERLVEEAGTQTELARRLGVSGQAISRVLKGEQPGVTLVRRLAEATGQRVEQILGTEDAAEDAPLEPRLSSLAGWDAAEAEARRRYKYLPEGAWEAVRGLRTAHPPRHVTAEWIGTLASDWARVLSDDRE